MTSAADVASYYRTPAVRARLLEYCGAIDSASPTAAFLVGLDPDGGPFPSWTFSERVPISSLPVLCDRGWDISRSLWDSESVLFVIDLDYQNVNHPDEPFTHASDVFFKLEAAHNAVRATLRRVGINALTLATGRGYHYVGRVPLRDAVTDELAALARTPAWYTGLEHRRPVGIEATMSERHARAASGLTLVLEYLAQVVLKTAATSSFIPVVVNGTIVGSGLVGRECASIDFSHGGDPLDVREIRLAFSSYQWHRIRPDIFGTAAASRPPLVAIPRGRRSLARLLRDGRDLDSARLTAEHEHAAIPDVSRGVGNAIAAYRSSRLAAFHAEFAAERAAVATLAPRAFPPDLPPCILQPLLRPNDLLLKPEYLQNIVRGLLARGWRASEVAALVEHEYRQDHQWGDRWARLDPGTRAEFDVRVFAGLIVTGTDGLLDFNCTSSQEKGVCPLSGCAHDLREDRRRLAARYAS